MTTIAAVPSTPDRSAPVPTLAAPPGLQGVVVARTTIGDVRGEEGFYHYRQYSAVELARTRSFEDVWHLLHVGELPDSSASVAFARRVRAMRELPPRTAALLPSLAQEPPVQALRTVLSAAGAELGMRPTWDLDAAARAEDALRLCALVPTALAALHRLSRGLDPVAPDPGLGHVQDYLRMMLGEDPRPEHVAAVEAYLISTIDHGLNASTFTARVVASTGADLAACLVAALGALSGPLHGGAPSRALDALEEIGPPDRADEWARERVLAGDRLMGFGHAVYRTADPRSVLLREVAEGLGGELVARAVAVEATVLEVLAELKPGRRLATNVEYYAGVVMEQCGIPREMFTPTFAVSRVLGWSAHVLEQAREQKIYRPAAEYVGPPAPQPVPAA
ncbi:citrate synthase [Motilibacter rhizosphaerae]|uniref:Citrate synthase n=1 Tax=Motilibacter rhizosphaerae TaxID=598652 RepID=A0A4Q7NSM4_9ACTN|nr:citrate synthase [Motilibacter rhizosphaerae]RZS89860.1 citrate synthase [Motilibacter rhizosphaerae]